MFFPDTLCGYTRYERTKLIFEIINLQIAATAFTLLVSAAKPPSFNGQRRYTDENKTLKCPLNTLIHLTIFPRVTSIMKFEIINIILKRDRILIR